MTLRTLLVESQPGCGREAEALLGIAGHQVVRCHPPGRPLFPCAGVDGPCPIDEDPGVDVVVAVRTATELDQTPSELGVTCALRRSVPVVLVTDGAPDPYGNRVRRTTANQFVRTCEAVQDEAQEAVTGPMRAEARRLAARAGLDPAAVDVRTEHEPGRTRLVLTVPERARDEADVMAVRIVGVFRPPVAWRGTVDVELEMTNEETTP